MGIESLVGGKHNRVAAPRRVTLFRIAERTWSKWAVLVTWTIVVSLLTAAAMRFNDAQNNRDAAYLPKSAESLKAVHLEEQGFGDELLTGLLVYRRDAGLTRADRAAVRDDVRSLHRAPLTAQYGTTRQIFLPDRKTAAIYVQLRTRGDQQVLFDAADRLRSIGRYESPPGLQVKLTGQMGYFDDSVRIFDSIDGSLLAGTIAIITILLLLIYRSPFLWLLPLVSVGIAEITARGIGTKLAESGTTVTSQGAALMTVLIFGVGTDYALLLIARYREELRHHQDRHVAMGHALRRSGPPIVASGATVIAALLCLSLANVNATSGAGPIGAMGVGLAMVAMLTVLPALLLLAGRAAFWPFVPQYGAEESYAAGRFWSRLTELIGRRPRVLMVAVIALMGVMSLGLTQHSGGLDLEQSFRSDVESVKGQRILERALPPGATGPLTVLISDRSVVGAARRALAKSPDIAAIGLEQRRNGVTRIEAALKYRPYSDAAVDAVKRVRRAVDNVGKGKVFISGAPAVEADSREYAARDNRLIMPLALVVVTLILFVLLRAIVAPLLLVATVVASYFAVLGISFVVFNQVFGFTGVDEYLPLFVFIFLVALGVDYNIFLMARVREEAARHGAVEGMRRGLVVTGGVITSAGVVLAGTFFVLAAMPLTMLTEIGTAIALGVLFDALVVRSVLVPSIGFALGAKLWWPHSFPPSNQVDPDGQSEGSGNGTGPARDLGGRIVAVRGTRAETELPDWTRIR